MTIQPLIALLVFIFCAFYSPGKGPVLFTYSVEIFPFTVRWACHSSHQFVLDSRRVGVFPEVTCSFRAPRYI
ncbi:hypothetical protein L218DRAFT_953346 [Marasmius fiardii PR-910]|nr:hypothetical protein L218DRAFT_953346 [Marasmius fiardii PR-910]